MMHQLCIDQLVLRKKKEEASSGKWEGRRKGAVGYNQSVVTHPTEVTLLASVLSQCGMPVLLTTLTRPPSVFDTTPAWIPARHRDDDQTHTHRFLSCKGLLKHYFKKSHICASAVFLSSGHYWLTTTCITHFIFMSNSINQTDELVLLCSASGWMSATFHRFGSDETTHLLKAEE